jgi:hypothetical protein
VPGGQKRGGKQPATAPPLTRHEPSRQTATPFARASTRQPPRQLRCHPSTEGIVTNALIKKRIKKKQQNDKIVIFAMI